MERSCVSQSCESSEKTFRRRIRRSKDLSLAEKQSLMRECCVFLLCVIGIINILVQVHLWEKLSLVTGHCAMFHQNLLIGRMRCDWTFLSFILPVTKNWFVLTNHKTIMLKSGDFTADVVSPYLVTLYLQILLVHSIRGYPNWLM